MVLLLLLRLEARGVAGGLSTNNVALSGCRQRDITVIMYDMSDTDKIIIIL